MSRPDEMVSARSAPRVGRWWVTSLRENTALPIYIVLMITLVAAMAGSETFRRPFNLSNLLLQMVPLGLASVAQTFAILVGDVNLTVGGIMSLATVTAATTMSESLLGTYGVALLILLGGAMLGGFSGWLLAHVNVDGMVLTLALNSFLLGVALHILPYPGGMVPVGYMLVLTSRVGPIPVAFLGLLVLLMASWYLLDRTPYGLHLRAVGADKAVARRAGVDTNRVKVGTHTLVGVIAALGGLFLAARMGSGDALSGDPFNLDSMTATIAGGTSFSSGVGSVWGTAAGVALVSVLSNLLNHLGVSAYFQYVFKGLLLILAVAGGALRNRWQR